MKIIVLSITDQTAPRAITAIGRTTIGDKEQHPIRIPVYQARHRRMGVLAHGIQHLLARNDHLARPRNHLLANRAFRIAAIYQIKEVWRYRHRQLLVGMLAAFHFVLSQIDQRFETLKGSNAVPELPSPILPICPRGILPYPLAFVPLVSIF